MLENIFEFYDNFLDKINFGRNLYSILHLLSIFDGLMICLSSIFERKSLNPFEAKGPSDLCSTFKHKFIA
jgi:hypothetical protein